MMTMSLLGFGVFVGGQGFIKAVCFGFGYASKSQKILCLGVFIGHCSLRAYEGIRTVGERQIRVPGSGFLSTEVSVVEQWKE